MNVNRNKQSYTLHNHVNETIALKIAVLSVGESDNNSDALRCHPPACRCIHVYFVLNYQNGMHRFFPPKRTPRIAIKKVYFAHLLILIMAFVVFTPTKYVCKGQVFSS